ncbi:MAG: hypothetical protein IPO21_17160 [Bacteroidales bacterium]|nr:hypothetical protein [Bacteroidales bacterium]
MQLKEGEYKSVSSNEIGLPLGVWTIAVKKQRISKLKPLYVGGGTARLVAKDWVSGKKMLKDLKQEHLLL